MPDHSPLTVTKFEDSLVVGMAAAINPEASSVAEVLDVSSGVHITETSASKDPSLMYNERILRLKRSRSAAKGAVTRRQ